MPKKAAAEAPLDPTRIHDPAQLDEDPVETETVPAGLEALLGATEGDGKPVAAPKTPKARAAANSEVERLQAENASLLRKLDEINTKVDRLGAPKEPDDSMPNFEEADAVEILKWSDKRVAKAQEEMRAENRGLEQRVAYQTEKRLNPDYDTLVNKWTPVFESKPEILAKIRASENPFRAAYEEAKALEGKESETDDREEEDQVEAQEQLRPPSGAGDRNRNPGNDSGRYGSEAADLEKMFGKKIDREAFAKHRKFGEKVRAMRTGKR